MKLKTPVNKEVFKMSMTECIKKAWVWNSKQNFENACNWKKNKQLEFEINAELDSTEEFNQSAESIDIFSEYLNLGLIDNEDKEEFLELWNKAWESETGFDPSLFFGETIEDGFEFGEKAKEYFEFQNIQLNEKRENKLFTKDFTEYKFQEAEEKTKKALQENKYEFLYEAAFSYDDEKLKTRCDILKIKENNHVEIFEAKATSKVKVEHIFDLMYQIYVLEKCGFIVDNVAIVKINSEYLLDSKIDLKGTKLGDAAKAFELSIGKVKYEEIHELVNSNFVVEEYGNEHLELNINQYVSIDFLTYGVDSKRTTIFNDINNFRNNHDLDILFETISNYMSIESNEREIPEFLNYKKCAVAFSKSRKGIWDYKMNASLYDGCFHVMNWFDKTIPGFWNIGSFFKTSKSHVIRNSKSPYFKDYESLFDPRISLNDKNESFFEKNQKAKRMFQVYDLQKKHPDKPNEWRMVDWDNIDFINSLLSEYKKYPVYMYDFETCKWAVPRFKDTNAYYQTPFQYSIDVIVDDKYDYNDASTMHHYSFIGKEQYEDPRPKFIENFIKDSFKHGPGIYIAYNKSFEQGVLRKLALTFPQYAKPLLYILQNTIDLMDFFKGKSGERPQFLIYHPEFMGSCSIKKTQPALDHNFSYKDLVINKGDKASETFRKYVDGRIPKAAWELKVEEGMLKYCDRDTLAMVVILKKIEEMVNFNYE